MSLNKETVKEGGAFKAFLSSSDVYRLSPVYWLLSGEGITPNDLSDGQLSGTETLKKDGSLTKIFELNKDCSPEGVEDLTVRFFLDSNFDQLIGEDTIQVIDTSYDPLECEDKDARNPYDIVTSRIQVKENVGLHFQVVRGEPGKTIFFKVTGKGINKHDFDLNYGRLSGKARIGEDGTTRIPFLLRADSKTEGDEEMKLSIFKDKKHKKKLSEIKVPVIDTSLEYPDHPPTKSEQPSDPQQTWMEESEQGSWFMLSPSRDFIRENTSTRTRIDSNAPVGTKLYFSVKEAGGINRDDFDLNYARLSGKVELNRNGVAFIPHLLRNDNRTEGIELLQLDLYRDKTQSDLVASTLIPVSDTSLSSPDQPPTTSKEPNTAQPTWGGGTAEGTWFTLSPSRPIYEEGERAGVRIDSDAFPGTRVYWEVSGEGLSDDDFDVDNGSDGMNGVVTITKNGLGQIEHLFRVDGETEGDEDITVTLYPADDRDTVLASTTYTILDGAAELEANKREINEGKSMKFKVWADGFPAGTTLYWDITGFNITDDDFETQPLEGSRTLDQTQKFQLNFETRKDNLSEGTESYRLSIYSDEEKQNQIGQSNDVIIFDTSTTPIKSVELLASSNEVNEGKGFKVKIKTKNIAPGTTLYWKGSGTAAEQDVVTPVIGNALEGAVVLDSKGKAILQFDTVKDKLTEGDEDFTVTLYSDPNFVQQVGNDVTVTILDTSLSALQTFELSTSADVVEEGKGFKLKLKTKNLPAETALLYWSATGTDVDNDLNNETSGTVSTGLFSLDEKGNSVIQFDSYKDQLTEGDEFITFQAYADASLTNAVGNPASVTILDTSTTPQQSFELTTSASSIEEGQRFKLKMATKNLPAETELLYWSASGTASEEDLINETTGTAMTGPFFLDEKGNSVIQFDSNKDKSTEGDETFMVQTYSDAAMTIPVGNPASVTILDTSTTPLPVVDLITSSDRVDEGKGFKVKIKTKNIEPGTPIYWAASGSASQFDLINETTGNALGGTQFIDLEGDVIMQFDTIKDKTPEGLEVFNVRAYQDAGLTSQIGNEVSVMIFDTSF